MVLSVPRERVLAFRASATGLHRDAGQAADLRVMDLGVQDTPPGSARLALAARGLPDEPGPDLVLAWSVRGAPHLHRPADLPRLARALWPTSDADATARIASGAIKEGAGLGLGAFAAATSAVHDVVTRPMPKGETSTAVSVRVPTSLTHDCVPCAARHIAGGLFQQVVLPAGVALRREGRSLLLEPVEDWPLPVPPEPDPSAAAQLVRDHLRLLGPGTPKEAAGFLGTSGTEIRRAWPDGLVEVDVDGRRAWVPEDTVEELRDAPPAPDVRLLPTGDPFLQARDRDLLVPERARQKALWTAIASPGAVLVNGEVAGTWRVKAQRRRVAVTVTPFAPMTSAARARLQDEAGLVARARGAEGVDVLVAD